MKTHFDCLSCFIEQTKRVGRLLELPEQGIWAMLKGCAKCLAEMDERKPPPQNAVHLYEMLAQVTGMDDPFFNIKKDSIEFALRLYPRLEKLVSKNSHPLEAAIRYAAAGNVIDYGTSSDFDIMKEIETVVHEEFVEWQLEKFEEELDLADWVLYLGDNCGESVLDRLLIKELGKPVVYAVRGGPVINDVTIDDAKASGIHDVAQIVSTGCKAPGIVFDLCSEEFKEYFNKAPLILSKGQGNFETLSDSNANVYFLFKIKCKVVAEFLKCPLGAMFFGTMSRPSAK